jgi:hypothetical protein
VEQIEASVACATQEGIKSHDIKNNSFHNGMVVRFRNLRTSAGRTREYGIGI